jgi:hypothetical protein
MKNIIPFLAFLCVIVIGITSCSDDDKEVPCPQTSISAVINGVAYTFAEGGRGIDLRQNGYELRLNFYAGTDANAETVRQFSLVVPFEKTGKNLITELSYLQYDHEGNSISGDFAEQELTSDVLINRKSCFSATFSGKLTDNGQEISITNGKIDYLYDEPFDTVTID